MELVLVPAAAAMVRKDASVYPLSRNSALAHARTRSETPSICFAIYILTFITPFHNTVMNYS